MPKKKKANLKEQGNQAFQRGDVAKAIELYTKAIEQEPTNPILFQNRAAAFLAIDDYTSAIQDCDNALLHDPSLVKSIYRKSIALQEMGDYISAWEYAAQLGDTEQEFVRLQQSILEDKARDETLSAEHPQVIIFTRMLDWLREGGGYFDKLKLRYYSENYRGVHSKTKVKRSETILYVPKSHIITLEMARAAPVGAKMMEAQLHLISPKHCYLSTYLLQEKNNPESFWKPYIDILPQSCESFPIFFNEEELLWLEASPFLQQIVEKKSDIQEDFDAIVNVAPEFGKYPIEEFWWARMTVSSRIFGMQIDEVKTDGFVPLADMLNHARPRQTSWSYEQSQNGFVIEALDDLEREQEVMDSYGKKCNSRFLLNYGFIVLNNDGNEFPFTVHFYENDPHVQAKQAIANDHQNSRKFRVMADWIEKNNSDFLGFVR